MVDRPSSIWLRKERSGRGPVPEYGRDQIAAAAIRLADAGGLKAVTTRKVAAAIGAAATSLYRYVDRRDELLQLMLDAAISELDLSAEPSGDWRKDLRALAHQLRSLYQKHSWMLELVQQQTPITPHGVVFLEYALSTLTGLGVPGNRKMEAIAMMNGLVVMLARAELASGQSNQAWQAAQVEFLAASVASGDYPNLAAVFQTSSHAAGESDLFDGVLIRVLGGVLSTP